MRLIDADEMATNESEAYMSAQVKIDSPITLAINSCVHRKIQQIIADTPTIDPEIPAADVATVRHARWEEADWIEPDCHGFGIIRTPKAALRCSNCKNCFKKELLWKDNYCPNCGAKMEE